jgi:putative holliday junction resolvase
VRDGVRMAFDVGKVRIGVATCDAAGILATPCSSIDAGDTALFEAVAVIEAVQPIEIYVGYPLQLDGTVGIAATTTRSWAVALQKLTAIPVRLVDERMSTAQAQRKLHEAGQTVKSSRNFIDSVAATEILQSCLDFERSSATQPGRSLRKERQK